MDEIEVVVAHAERTTLRVGQVFLKVDADHDRLAVEAAATRLAPVPAPRVLWHEPPVLALAAVPGRALGRLGAPSTASRAAWVATGAVVRVLHDAPLPPRTGRTLQEIEDELDRQCTWLTANDVLPVDLVARNREIAAAALRAWTPVFTHGDLQITHVFVEGDEVTGVIDWSEASQGDAVSDLATLTLGHEERLDAVLEGYGREVDRDVVRGWWSVRCLSNVRWLLEHGFDPFAPGCEVDVLRARV